MIYVIDFGGQTAHLIARRVRDLGIDVKTIDPEQAYERAKQDKPAGLIFSGGPASVFEKDAPTVDINIYDLGIPILGICYGHQLFAHQLPEGKAEKGAVREDGPSTLVIDMPSPLFDSVSPHSRVWLTHGVVVTHPPKGFTYIAHSDTFDSAAMSDEKRKLYGIQFHPEVEHTEHGTLIFRNFLEKICGLTTTETDSNIEEIIADIKQTVGDAQVIAAVSGGVDSTVAAALVAKAIGKQLTVIYCDNGLMRKSARIAVTHIFEKLLAVDLRIIDCKEEFLTALNGKIDPEDKRKAIGKTYIDIFERESKKIENVRYLVQGTIYSDVIESKGTKHAEKIKSHHNVGGLPETMNLKLIEPLRNFYKDEVRKIGTSLGLPKEVVYTQVFPGPGHAIRIIGEVTKERLEQQEQTDEIVLDEIKKAHLYYDVYMSFPVMTGAYSTSVRGDGRFYGEVVALRIIESKDVMTSEWARLPYDLLQKMVSRIISEVPNISRVVYDITTKPPATMEWE